MHFIFLYFMSHPLFKKRLISSKSFYKSNCTNSIHSLFFESEEMMDVLYYCAMYHLIFLKIVFYVFIVKILIFIAVLVFLHQIYTFFTIISFVSSIAAIQARTIYMGTMHSITTVSTSIRTPLPKHIIVTHCCKGYFYIY